MAKLTLEEYRGLTYSYSVLRYKATMNRKDLLLFMSNALCGETGELANLVKKWENHKLGVRKPNYPPTKEEFVKQILAEIVDIQKYLLLLTDAVSEEFQTPVNLDSLMFNDIYDKLEQLNLTHILKNHQ